MWAATALLVRPEKLRLTVIWVSAVLSTTVPTPVPPEGRRDLLASGERGVKPLIGAGGNGKRQAQDRKPDENRCRLHGSPQGRTVFQNKAPV